MGEWDPEESLVEAEDLMICPSCGGPDDVRD